MDTKYGSLERNKRIMKTIYYLGTELKYALLVSGIIRDYI